MRYSIQHDNITTTASRGQGGSRFEPQPKGYGMSQNRHFECPQATFDSVSTHMRASFAKLNLLDALLRGFRGPPTHVHTMLY